MAVKTARAVRRLSPAGRPRLRKSVAVDTAVSWRRSRALLILSVLLLASLGAWLFDAELTVRAMSGLGWSLPAALGFHVLLSVLQLSGFYVIPLLPDVPRWFQLFLWFLTVAAGGVNVLTSAVGLVGMLSIDHAIPVAVAIGEFLAFAPEPLIIWLAGALVAIRRS